jgi:hypothetical protein
MAFQPGGSPWVGALQYAVSVLEQRVAALEALVATQNAMIQALTPPAQ